MKEQIFQLCGLCPVVASLLYQLLFYAKLILYFLCVKVSLASVVLKFVFIACEIIAFVSVVVLY